MTAKEKERERELCQLLFLFNEASYKYVDDNQRANSFKCHMGFRRLVQRLFANKQKEARERESREKAGQNKIP